MQMQDLAVRINQPDASEGGIEMTNQRLCTALERFPQGSMASKRSTDFIA